MHRLNYIQILIESFRIFQTTRLVWVFGFISFLIEIPQPLFKFPGGVNFLVCVYLFVGLVIALISVIANGGLIYLIHQTTLSRNPSFGEVWLQGGQKLFRNIGFFLLTIPALLVVYLIYSTIAFKAPTSLFLWLISLMIEAFVISWFTFGLCAIMIDDLHALGAAWTSFLITLNNFFRLLIIYGGVFFIHFLVIGLLFAVFASGLFQFDLTIPLTFDYSTYLKMMAIPAFKTTRSIIDLLLFPMISAILTLCYLKFTQEIHYPAISNR